MTPQQLAQVYLDQEAQRLTRTARALVYPSAEQTQAAPFDAARKKRLSDRLMSEYGRDHSQDLAHHAEDMGYWQTQLMSDLREDLQAALGPEGQAVLARTATDFMPHMHSDAFVAGFGQGPDAAWAVGVNVGLVWVANLVAEALLRASRGDELGARQTYAAAHALYLGQTQRALHAAWQTKPDTADELALEAGGIGAVVLRFVALHELGHAVLGHAGRWEMGLSESTGQRRYGAAVAADAGTTQAMETEADRFALARMLAVSSGPQAMWNNLLFIAAFFRLLAQVEQRQGKPLCPYHPPPLQRIEALYQALAEHIGPPPNEAWVWAQTQQNEWSMA